MAGTDMHVTMPANPDTWRPVVDNLTSTDTDKSLSAKQGKVLNDSLSKLAGNGSAATSVQCFGVIAPGGGILIPLISGKTATITSVNAYSTSDWSWHALTISSVDTDSNGIQRNIHCTGTVPGITSGCILVQVTGTFS